jgi:phosphoribosylformimino-5-aminoimidazole carboxamide ribonucleotide (ProFAR) isomerase
VKNLNIPVIASGGISSIDHIRKLVKIGVEGAIIGRALYTAISIWRRRSPFPDRLTFI